MLKLILLFSFGWSFGAHAQTTVVRSVLVRPFISFPFSNLTFDASDDEADSKTSSRSSEGSSASEISDPAIIQYTPNVGADVGLLLQVGGLGFSISIPTTNGKNDEEKYGATTYRDIKADYFRNRYGAELGFQRYRGFHRKETVNTPPPRSSRSERTRSTRAESDPVPEAVIHKRSDIQKECEYANFHFIPFTRDRELFASNRFSMDFSKFWGPVTWSPIFSLSLDRTAFSAESPLIPESSYALFGSDAGLTSAQFISVTGLAGILLDYRVDGSWGIAGGLELGLGQQYRRVTIDNHTTKGGTVSAKMGLRLGVEKQQNDWRYGMDLMADGSSYELSTSSVESSVGYVMFYVARVFEVRHVEPSTVAMRR